MATEPLEPRPSAPGTAGPGPPGPPPNNRLRAWLWALGGLVVVLIVVLVVILLTQDDDDHSASNTTTTTVAPTTTTTTAPTTTTVPPTTTTVPPTTTTVPYPPITDDPQTYAQYLFVAWQNGNRTNAANVASADAVNQMFSQSYNPATHWTFGMCDPAAGSLYCTWSGQNGAKLTMTVRTLTGGLPIQVMNVIFG